MKSSLVRTSDSEDKKTQSLCRALMDQRDHEINSITFERINIGITTLFSSKQVFRRLMNIYQSPQADRRLKEAEQKKKDEEKKS